MAVKLLLFCVFIDFIVGVPVAVHNVMCHLQGQWGSPVSGVQTDKHNWCLGWDNQYYQNAIFITNVINDYS